jgi:hypothetical protein
MAMCPWLPMQITLEDRVCVCSTTLLVILCVSLVMCLQIVRNDECIEDLHVTSSMTLPTVAAILEVFFCTARDVLMEITLENGRK